MKIYDVIFVIFNMPPFEKGRAYFFAAVRLSAGRSVHQHVSIHFLHRGEEEEFHEMKFGIQIYIIISMSSSILGTIDQFLPESYPLDFPKF